MSRLFWLGIGATVGVIVVRRITKKAEAFTPKGLSAAVAGLGDSFREFADQVRDAMVEREDDLLSALGVGSDGQAADGSASSSGQPGRHGR